MPEHPAGAALARADDQVAERIRSEPDAGRESHRPAPGDEADRAAVRPEERPHALRHAREHGAQVERRRQGLRDVGERLGRLLAAADLAEEPRVLQRQRGVGRQSLQELPVFGREPEVDRVIDREDAQHPAAGE